MQNCDQIIPVELVVELVRFVHFYHTVSRIQSHMHQDRPNKLSHKARCMWTSSVLTLQHNLRNSQTMIYPVKNRFCGCGCGCGWYVQLFLWVILIYDTTTTSNLKNISRHVAIEGGVSRDSSSHHRLTHTHASSAIHLTTYETVRLQ